MININLILMIGYIDSNDNFLAIESIELEGDFNQKKLTTFNQIIKSYDRNEYNYAHIRLEINNSLSMIIGYFSKNNNHEWIVD